MAITLYRSKVAITTTAQARAAYRALADLCAHLPSFGGVNLRRVEHMPDNFVDVELTNPLPPEQVDHLGLQGPV